MRHEVPFSFGLALALSSILLSSARQAHGSSPTWPFEVTDLRNRNELVFLVFGDSGTGEAGQYRVADAMYQVCRARRCDFALMLGDNIYENGLEVTHRASAHNSRIEIERQFQVKFEAAYAPFAEIPGFRFWLVLGNHDYRRNAFGTMVTYSQFSELWRLPAFHYEVPLLPEWIQIYGVHTDTDEQYDLNGLQVAAARRALCVPRNGERWKLLFGHQPVYNSGHHRSDTNEKRTRSLLEAPLIRECGVHVYFSGHAHHQEHLTSTGFEQVIQGAAARTKGSNRPPRSPRLTQRHFSREYGFAIIQLGPEEMRMDFYEVLDTEERGDPDTARAPTPEEIVRSYSWCGTRDEIGQPHRPPRACATP